MSNISDYEHMAKLDLSDSERAVLGERFSTLIDGFSKLNEYDISGVLPLVTVLDDVNIMREDVSGKNISREALLRNAPEQQDGYIRVPGAID